MTLMMEFIISLPTWLGCGFAMVIITVLGLVVYVREIVYSVCLIHTLAQLWMNGYKFTLLTLSKNCGFAVPIFPSLIFSKKMADKTYCGSPFILFLRYLGIS